MKNQFTLILVSLTLAASTQAATGSLAPSRIDAECKGANFSAIGEGQGWVTVMTYPAFNGGNEHSVAMVEGRHDDLEEVLLGSYNVGRWSDPDLYSSPVNFLGDNFELRVSRNSSTEDANGYNDAALKVKFLDGTVVEQTIRCKLN